MGLGANDEIAVTFTFRTNRLGNTTATTPVYVSMSEINTLFSFSAPIGALYDGKWEDDYTLRIHLIDTSGADPTGANTRVGLLSLTTKDASGLAAWDGTTMPMGREAVLAGSWGPRTGPQIVGDSCVANDTGVNPGFDDVRPSALA